MELLLVPILLQLGLEVLPALGVLALEGVLGKEGLLLHCVLLRVSRLLVPLKLIRHHAAPPHVLVQANLTLVSVLPGVTLPHVILQIIFPGENLVTRESEILEVSGRRMVGAGVADAEVDRVAMTLHVASLGEALVAVRALVRAGHLVDGLNVPVKVLFPAKSFATGRTLAVSNLRMNGPHVSLHVLGAKEDLLTNGAFLSVFCSFLIEAVWETEASLMILKYLAVSEDFLAAFADQVPVVLGQLVAAAEIRVVLVKEHGLLRGEKGGAAWALPALLLVILFTLEEV